MVLAQKWIREKEFRGFPKLSDFKLVSEELSDILEDGDVLCEAEWLSVDPYMRTSLFSTCDEPLMPGTQVARILKSKHSEYPEGTKVVAQLGWRDRTVVSPDTLQELYFRKMPDLQGLPDSYAIGALGMTGNTAYFGIEKVLQIKEGGGVTFVVSAAGGAVGSVAAQLAKIKGCNVIGFAGSFEKIRWLKSIGIEHSFDYKLIDDVGETLRKTAPDGVDYYFDNVGGELSYQIMKHMKPHGKMGLCGTISNYNCENLDSQGRVNIPFDGLTFIYKHLSMEGFLVTDYAAEWEQGIQAIRGLILEEKVQVRETVLHGFEQMPHALINLLRGGNIGKAVVKV